MLSFWGPVFGPQCRLWPRFESARIRWHCRQVLKVCQSPFHGLFAALALDREIEGAIYQSHGRQQADWSPKITSTEAWASRIAAGLDTSVARAMSGFVGPTERRMPARGGTPGPSA